MGWRGARDGLSALARATAFGLALVSCDQLDVTSSVEPPSARCASCHLPEYLETKHPPHAGVKPTTCGTCHTQTSFHPARLEHSFPLEGAHQRADCFACHRGLAPVFEGTPKACLSCHAAERADADAKISKHASFANTCAQCHGTAVWKPTLNAGAAPRPSSSGAER